MKFSIKSVFCGVFRTLKVLLLSVIALSFVFIVFCTIISYQYTDFSKDNQQNLIADYQQNENNSFIYTDDSSEAKKSELQIRKFVLSLPDVLTKDFIDTWKVVIAKDIVVPYSESSAGVIFWKSRTLLLNLNKDEEVPYKVFVHEFGHYFDMAHGFLSKSPEFNRLYTQYKDVFYEKDGLSSSEYATSTPQEFFASICKEYFIHPEHLQSITPEVYWYFDNVIQDTVNSYSWYQNIKDNIIAHFRLLRSED